MFTTTRNAALAATAALTLFGVVAPTNAARNDAESQDKAVEAAKDGASKAADAAIAAIAADAAAAADAIAARGASTEAARGFASKAGYAALAAANKSVDASIAAANATISIAKATGNTTAWTYANAAASKTVDASIATADAATKFAKAIGSTTAIQAKNVAVAARENANAALTATAKATNAAAPHVYKCTVRFGGGVIKEITIKLEELIETDKVYNPESDETFRVSTSTLSPAELATSADTSKYVCESVGRVGTRILLKRLF